MSQQYQPPRYDPQQHQQRLNQPPQPPYAQLPPPSERTYRRAATRQKSTFIHGVLTVCSLGLWSPIWILACIRNAEIRRAQAEVTAYQAAVSQRRY